MYKVGGEDIIGDDSARGVEQETRTKGEGAGCCQGGHVRLAVELDVFGKGELCEDEVEMMMRWR